MHNIYYISIAKVLKKILKAFIAHELQHCAVNDYCDYMTIFIS